MSPDPPKLKLRMTDKFEPFLFKHKRFKGAIGGRGGTKSQTIADILLYKVQQEGIKVGCFREHQTTIEDSVHALLKEEITRIRIPGYDVGKATIDHLSGGKFRFRGLARNTGGVLSMQGFKIFWVEEAQFLSKESLKLVTPTLRTDESEFWFSLNPMSRLDPMSQRFIVPFIKDLRKQGYYEDDLHYIVWVNYDENPWFPPSLEQERQYDFENLPRAEYDHIWRGFFNDTIENAIIKTEWFDACIDAHLKLNFKPKGKKIVAHDPSDSGYDDKGTVLRHGSVFIEGILDKTDDVNDGLDTAMQFAIDNDADFFLWDADGMGLSLKRQVKDYLEGEKIDYEPFRGSDGVDDPDKAFQEPGKNVTDKKKQRTNKQALKNRRAQKYIEFATRCYNTYLAITKPEYKHQDPDTLISFSSKITELEQMRAEVCKIPRKPNPNGLIQIMSKEDMKKLQIDSPNLADPCMMSMVTPIIKPKEMKIGSTSFWD